MANGSLFEAGPPSWLRSGIRRGKPPTTAQRIVLVILVGWVPLFVLALGQSVFAGDTGWHSLLLGAGAHARYLVAAPLLILADVVCARRLDAIVQNFVTSGIVPEPERPRFAEAVASTRRGLASPAAEVAVLVLAYVVTFAFIPPTADVPAWHKLDGSALDNSPAGWWHLLVSLPLLLTLFFGWIWRLILWTRLLALIARLDLRLIATHPDGAAGLGFLGNSLRAFTIVALAPATAAAGNSAHLVLTGSDIPTPLLLFNVAALAVLVVMFAAPLTVFTPKLTSTWRRASFEYGGLAIRLGISFEKEWLQDGKPVDRTALERPDFSATTDLYQLVANIYALRFIPLDLKSLAFFIVAIALPFVPVVLLAVPANRIWSGLQSLLF